MKRKILLRDFIPSAALEQLKNIFYYLRGKIYTGNNVFCPCCEKSYSRFLKYNKRKNALCPGCSSLERHRALCLFLKKETDIYDPSKKILHFAPEYILQKNLKKHNKKIYISADIEHPNAMVHFDITNIPYKKNSFDFILCSHVLQEVKDDEKAMSELFRILKKRGVAIIQCSIDETKKETYENKKTKTLNEKTQEYGYYGAVRIYGKDFKKKLKSAGFTVQEINPIQKISNNKIKRYGLNAEKIFYCKK